MSRERTPEGVVLELGLLTGSLEAITRDIIKRGPEEPFSEWTRDARLALCERIGNVERLLQSMRTDIAAPGGRP